VSERFQVLFVEITAPAEEQDRAARRALRGQQVDPADRVAIGRDPAALGRIWRDSAPVDRGRPGFSSLPNYEPPALVTIW
jgi:hypothetical protein